MTAPNTSSAKLPEPSAVAQAFLSSPHRLLIGGQWVEGEGNRPIVVENPARGTTLTTIASASVAQLDAAVAAARACFETGWGRMSGRERAAVMFRFADLLEKNVDKIGEIMTLDNGMGINSAKGVVRYLSVEIMRYYAGWATKITGDSFIPSVGRDVNEFIVATLREPIGVVGAIIPWNAPAGMLALKMGPALAAGCPMVIKTAELAPLVGQIFGELMLEAGAPPGTLNLLHGYGDDVGAALVRHTGINKVTFTGSTAVGQSIVRAAGEDLKHVTLELGGKSPVVIYPDADLDLAIPAAAMACFLSSGQACIAGSRLFLHSKIHDEVVAGITRYTAGLKIGDGMLEDTVLGPMISERQRMRVLDFVRSGVAEKAKLEFGGEALPGPGHFMTPCLFTGVNAGMRIAREEVFGPLLSVFKFDDEEALLRIINGTPYGLSGSIWTTDIQRALKLARRIDSGQVGINYHNAMSPETPFGGNKMSGWGREYGEEGLDGYLKTKAISINLGLRT